MIVDKKTRDTVLRAFRAARASNRDSAACYQAAVDAWCAIHPEHDRAQAAREAVAIVLQNYGTIREMAKKLAEDS